jgi:hypothetical protein
MGLSVGMSPALGGVKNVYVRLVGAASVEAADESGGARLVARGIVELFACGPRARSRSGAGRPSQARKGRPKRSRTPLSGRARPS